MKQTLIRFSLFLFLTSLTFFANAKNYYFSSVSGDDSRTSTQAQSKSTPWKTLTKLNSFMSSLTAGDSVLFKSGEVFYGFITVTKSGTTTKPIIFAAYGTGNKPVITGFQTLKTWTSVGGGIFECYNSALGTQVNMVTLNGSFQPIGRYPNITASNKGYLIFESHGTNYIKDNQLTSSVNWTGADVVVRTKRWILDRCKITSHSGSTINYSPALTYIPYDNYGYFIQNHIKTLDQLGEWYYNPATKKLSVYFGSASPSSYSIQASAIGTLVTVTGQSNITFTGIQLTGSNINTFDFYGSQNIQFTSCSFIFSGVDAIVASNTTNLSIKNCYFNYTNNNALDLNYNCVNSTILYNYIANTGLTAGMGLNGNGNYEAVNIVGNNNLAQYNTIINSGAEAIRFAGGSSNVIKNNFINGFTLVKDDGGGIYSVGPKTTPYSGQQIVGNIVINGLGAPEGTDKPGTGSSSGIYLDDNVSGVLVSSNTVSNCKKSGVFMHNAFAITLKDNLLYDNGTQLTMVHDIATPSALLRNNVIKNNIFFAKLDTEIVSNVSTLANDINLLGSMDSNYFCRPMDDNLTMKSSCVINGLRVDRVLDLAGWQSTYKLDKSSEKTPTYIPSYSVSSFVGGNKVSNGTYNSSITGSYATPSYSWVNNKLDGGSFQATNTFTDFSNYQVIIGVGSVSSSKNYILRFSSKSSRDTLVNAYLRISGAPYSRISDTKIIPISIGRKENEFLFTAPASTSAASIIIETKSPKLNFWLDNIELYDAKVSQTDPDSYIFFQYNNTTSNKTFALSGSYMDAYGKTYTNSIVIAPYSSVVLVKQTAANMIYSFNKERMSSQNQNDFAAIP
ncbi:MAG: right-handed parallel beta-helix repeat-containing protein [Ginsengibacter sp.]